jgi:hypothetical protein
MELIVRDCAGCRRAVGAIEVVSKFWSGGNKSWQRPGSFRALALASYNPNPGTAAFRSSLIVHFPVVPSPAGGDTLVARTVNFQLSGPKCQLVGIELLPTLN